MESTDGFQNEDGDPLEDARPSGFGRERCLTSGMEAGHIPGLSFSYTS